MNCPRCSNPMNKITFKQTELDSCPACEGLWFDKDELINVLDQSSQEVTNSAIASSWDSDITREEKPSEGEFNCPKCGGKMMRYYYCDAPEIVIDGCEKGCGLFTDDGEIQKIWKYIKASEEPLSPEEQVKVDKMLLYIKRDMDAKEEALINSLVKMDNQPGLMRYPGMMLQYIYRMLYKAGL